MRAFFAAVLLATVPWLVSASAPRAEAAGDPWFSTFSIIAFDPATRPFSESV